MLDIRPIGIEDYAERPSRCRRCTISGGLLILDHMLYGGQVIDPRNEAAKTIDALIKRIRNDARIENVLLPMRDGIMLVRKL